MARRKIIHAAYPIITTTREQQIIKIPLSKIREIEWLPKRKNLGDLTSLARSIMARGDVDVPIKVRPTLDGYYELIWGKRRYEAAILAGLSEISCIVEDISDEEVIRQVAVENLLREDRNIVEEGELFYYWSTKMKKSYDEIARTLGINPKYIYNRVEILSLPEKIIEKIRLLPADNRKINLLSLLYIKKVKDPDLQDKIFSQYLEEGWTVRELRKEIERLTAESKASVSTSRSRYLQIYDLTNYGSLEELTSPSQPCEDAQPKSTLRVITHFDNPKAVLKDGKDILDYPPSKFIGKCNILDVRCSGSEDVITLTRVKRAVTHNYIYSGEAVFFYTGWAKYRGTPEYFLHPSISLEVAEWLIEKKISLIGVDAPNPTRIHSRKFHELLFSNDVLIVENLGDMEGLVGMKVKAITLPLPIKNIDIIPAKVLVRRRSRRSRDDNHFY
mgnify:CR=1 FL=1|jgi:ParB-like partition proteins